MNIVIPMAGRGQRFTEKGIETPKPLIEINGKMMIEYAIESLDIKANFIFITFRYSDENLNQRLNTTLEKYSGKVIQIDYVTEGPAASALLARDYIDNDEPLIITNCDQIMNWESKSFLDYCENSDMDGVVVTYHSDTEKNSYIKLDQDGIGLELAEKEVISNDSLNGIHYWKRGSLFVKSAKSMISKNIRANNEFYISLSYNELIKDGCKIGAYKIPSDFHNAVGTPEDLKKYINKK